MSATAKTLEVHEHCFIHGPKSCYAGTGIGKLVHSHPDGNIPHQHPDTGPASYTIDKDEWLRETGLKGGGRKKFTAKASGEQFPTVELEEWQKSFEIIVCPPPKDHVGDGPGIALPMRMIMAFGMTVNKVSGELS